MQMTGTWEKGCADALRQIEERKYTAALERRKAAKIIKYGMAFWEKECRVVMGGQ